jgi:hypothetical protein
MRFLCVLDFAAAVSLQFVDGRQASLQFLRRAFREPVLWYPNWLIDIAFLCLAKNDADAGLVIGMPQEVIDGREIEILLSCKLFPQVPCSAAGLLDELSLLLQQHRITPELQG